MLNQKETDLLDGFLDQLSERMSCAGCNDWEFPKNWNENEKREFVKQYYAWNGDPECYSPNRLSLMDLQAVFMLRKRLNQDRHDYGIKVKSANDSWVKNYLENEDEYAAFVDTFKDRTGPFIIKFGYSGIGVSKKVFDLQGNPLADITDYESW